MHATDEEGRTLNHLAMHINSCRTLFPLLGTGIGNISDRYERGRMVLMDEVPDSNAYLATLRARQEG